MGIDISERAVEIAQGRYPSATFVRHSVEDVPWPIDPRSQDVVTAFEVIEHLLRPRALVEGASAALKTGGHLALSTPYHGRVKNLVVSLIAFDHHFAPEGDHIRFFSDRALKRLVTANGFEIERVGHGGSSATERRQSTAVAYNRVGRVRPANERTPAGSAMPRPLN
jgi:2-polyprenyl-3-methyl-5-hydroxy-6-metoxy-1,4-benzoquinol methylase